MSKRLLAAAVAVFAAAFARIDPPAAQIVEPEHEVAAGTFQGKFFNAATADRVRRILARLNLISPCDFAAYDRELRKLEELSGALPPFEPGTRAPSPVPGMPAYADGKARGDDGTQVRNAYAAALDQRKLRELQCRTKAPRTVPPIQVLSTTPPRPDRQPGETLRVGDVPIPFHKRDAAQQLMREMQKLFGHIRNCALFEYRRDHANLAGEIRSARESLIGKGADEFLGGDYRFEREKLSADVVAAERAFSSLPTPDQVAAACELRDADRQARKPEQDQFGDYKPLDPFAEFTVVAGVRNNRASGAYVSDGGQAPGAGEGSRSQANFGMTIAGYMPLPQLLERNPRGLAVFGSTQIGLRVGVYHLGGGDKLVLEIARHGPSGLVRLTEKERQEITLMLMLRQTILLNLGVFRGLGLGQRTHKQLLADAPRAAAAESELAQAPAPADSDYWPVVFYGGVGPSFVNTKIAIASDQVPGGGVFESAAKRKWDTGVSFVFGAQTAACRACVFGKPVMLGVEGQWTNLPKRDVAVTSSTFGFSESGTVNRRSSSRVMFTVTVPFGLGR